MTAYCSSFSLVKFSKARRNEHLAKKICDGESTKTAGLDFYQGSIWDLIALLFLSHSAVSNSLWPHGLQHAGFPVLHYLLEFDQIHVHWVRDAIWPSHPLLSPSHPSLNLSQHQSLFQWVSSLHQVAKVLELQLQQLQWIFRVDWVLTIIIDLQELSEFHSMLPAMKVNASGIGYLLRWLIRQNNEFLSLGQQCQPHLRACLKCEISDVFQLNSGTTQGCLWNCF